MRALTTCFAVVAVITKLSSTSANTGVSPARLTASAVAMNVRAGTMTSSPSSHCCISFIAIRINVKASKPFATPTAYSAPTYSEKWRSKFASSRPLRYQPDWSTRSIAASISSCMRLLTFWRLRNGICLVMRTGGFYCFSLSRMFCHSYLTAGTATEALIPSPLLLAANPADRNHSTRLCRQSLLSGRPVLR